MIIKATVFDAAGRYMTEALLPCAGYTADVDEVVETVRRQMKDRQLPSMPPGSENYNVVLSFVDMPCGDGLLTTHRLVTWASLLV